MKSHTKKNNSFEKLSTDDDDEKVDAEPTKKPMRKCKKKIRIFQNKFNIDDENMLKIIELIKEWDKIKKKNKEKKQEKEKEKREEKREEKRQKKNEPIIKKQKQKIQKKEKEIKELKKTIEDLEQELRQRREEERMRQEEKLREKQRKRQEEQRKRQEEQQRQREEQQRRTKANFPKDINDFENNPTKQKWYTLSKKYHPDKGGSKQFMQKINDIWAEHKLRYDSN
tara:strand:- start:48 stop:725 length:678 start_codon:yes stop_codon:yes gene_type:complete